MGFKAPLAYCSSFYFVCRKDGMERKYMMYEGEEVNTIDLLYEAPTEQPNGVKVIVPINYYDRHNFEKKIKEQLAYFENVYFDVPGIPNDFSILRSEHFQFSPLAANNYLHICLDNVYYPLDHQKLGIDSIYLPIGLRFSLSDGIFPTPNREAIRYTQEAKDVILKKLENLANHFVEKYNETVKDTDDFKKIYEHHTSSKRHLKIGKDLWDIHPLARFASIQMAVPKMNQVKLLDMKRMVRNQEYILGEFVPKFIVTSKSVRDSKHYYGLGNIDRMKKVNYYYESDRIPGIKKDYLRSLQKDRWDEATIFRKKGNFPLFKKGGGYDNYYTILDLKNYPKDQWRQIIKEFQFVVNGITKEFVNIDTLEVPEDFIEARKKQKQSAIVISGGVKARRVKLKGEFVCKQAEDLERYVDGKNCKWVSATYDMASFHRNKFILVYGKQSDVEAMDRWYGASKRHNIRFAILSERELKVVEKIELHNLMPFSKFMEGKSKPFQRIATACLIDKFLNEHKNLFTYAYHLQDISLDLYNRLDDLKTYRHKHFYSSSSTLRDAIVAHATEVNCFDTDIIDEFNKVKTICEKLPFLNAMLGNIPRYSGSLEHTQMKQSLIDLFKYHKHRIDWKNYKIRLNDDVVETELTLETVAELINED